MEQELVEVDVAGAAGGGPAPARAVVNRHATRQWFLTYPRCEVDKEVLLAHLQTIGTVQEYCICRETHEDGGLHLHAFVRYDKPGVRRADLIKFDILGHHGDYQSVRSRRCVLEYVQKEDADVLTNIDKELLVDKTKKRQRENMEVFDGSEVELKAMMRAGDYSWRQLVAMLKARHAYRLMTCKPLQSQTVKGIWVYGEPGTGKSHWARTQFPDAYLKLQNKWFDGYDLEETLLLEDFDSKMLGHHLKLWGDKWGCNGEVKGGLTPLLHSRLVVTSNYSPAQLFVEDAVLAAAVTRRFQVLRMTPSGRLYREEDLIQRWDGGLDRLVIYEEGPFDMDQLADPMAYGPVNARNVWEREMDNRE